MINKKYLIVAVLATFCLTATLFMTVPTKSQSSKYDPWTDINGDGTIDMADISMAIVGFMSSGDATKPVNITGHATKLVADNTTLGPYQDWSSGIISADGYSKVSININVSVGLNNRYTLYSGWYYNGQFLSTVADEINIGAYFVKTYDVMSPYIVVQLANMFEEGFSIGIYLVA